MQSHKKHTAIVVAGGAGSRMGSDVPKQYLELGGRPVICWCLEAFECSEIIDEIIIVTAADYVNYVQSDIIETYGFEKVSQVVPGGVQRYDSVYEGLKSAAGADYVYIHDAARPGLDQELIARLAEAVRLYSAAAAAVPVIDTIKSADAEGFADETLDRSRLWSIQTPQVFSYDLICSAYDAMMRLPHDDITDDTMVAERFGGARVRLVPGSGRNQKITTAEDLIMMEAFLQHPAR